MPNFTFTSPQGKQYTVTAPDGATQQQAFAVLQQQLASVPAAAPQPTPQPQTVQQGADQAQAADVDKLKAIGRGFVNMPLEFGKAAADMHLLPGMTGQQAQTDISNLDQSIGLGKPTGGFGETLGAMAFPAPGVGAGAAAAPDMATGALGRLANAGPGQTVGQTLQSKAAQMFEQALSYIPGGGSIIKSMQNQADALGTKLGSIVDSLRGGRSADAEDAGQMLTSSLGKAAARIKAVSGKPFDDIADSIAPGTLVNVTHSFNTLDELTAVPKGGEHLGQMLVSPKLQSIFDAMKKDMAGQSTAGLLGPNGKVLQTSNGQQVSLDVLRQWKAKLGNMIDWGKFGSDPDNAALKQVWKSLNSDIMDGAKIVNPKLAPAIQQANAGYQVATAQLDNLSSVVNKAGGPDKIFTSLMAGTKDGSLTLRRVLTQLSPSDKQLLAAAQLRRMGVANPGAQATAEGGAFSVDTFLTNWNSMSPDSREALFGRLPEDYASNISQLAKNVATLKNYARVMPNWSGTTRAAMWAGDVSSALTSLMLGHPGVAGALGGTAVGTKLLASAMTNPKTVAWLAKQTTPALWAAGRAGSAAAASNLP